MNVFQNEGNNTGSAMYWRVYVGVIDMYVSHEHAMP